MAFFRKLFRGGDDEQVAQPPEPATGAQNQPAVAADGPPEAEEPEPAAAVASPNVSPAQADDGDAAWWASSAADAAAPPASQSAMLAHPAPAPDGASVTPDEIVDEEIVVGADTPPDADETPTEPYSVLKIAQAAERLAVEQAAERLVVESVEQSAQPSATNIPTPPAGLAAVTLGTTPLEGTRQLSADSAPALTAWRSAQGLAAMAARDIGRVREVNQDSVFAMLTTLPREGADLSVGLFIVADGMGGHQGGEVASRLAVRTVVHQVLSQMVLPVLDDSMSEALQPLMIAAVQAANGAIWDAAQAIGSDMGTTCTAALLVGQGLYLAHVGDSRAYLREPGGLRQLTSDHSTVGRLIQLGQLDASEAREHPLRNQLYRTVGQQPQVQVDFVYQQLGLGSHLLFCSDGLWGMLDERTMNHALERSPWPQDVCNELIALANLAGGEDNISAVVVSLPIAER